MENSRGLSLGVSPHFIIDWDGVKAGEVTYTITLPERGYYCSGWQYPIAQLDQQEWPYRLSCKTTDFRTFTENWGGKQHPLPFIGEYRAILQYRQPDGRFVMVITTFEQREGVPR